MSKQLRELQEKRGQIVIQMRELNAKAEKEERGFTTDEDAKWAQLDADLQAVDAAIKRSQRMAEISEPAPGEIRGASQANVEQAANSADATSFDSLFKRYLVQGIGDFTPEERQIWMRCKDDSKEARAFSQSAGNAGGYTVPQGFYNKLEIALKAFGGMLGVADIITTDTGAVLPMASFNYTAVAAAIVGENASSGTDSSTPFGVTNLGSYTYRTPVLPVSYEFLQDSAFGEDYIVNALSDSLYRGYNAHATVGDGVGKPRGIMLDSMLGRLGATGQTLSVTYDDLWELIHSIDPAYRVGSKFMLHDQSLKVLRKLKDSNQRPIFLPGFEGMGGQGPSTIDGYEYVINQDMPQMAANAKSIAFGRLDKYKARIVRNVTLMRLTERYAENLQVAFLLFLRADGRLLDAGTNPVKHYQNSAS